MISRYDKVKEYPDHTSYISYNANGKRVREKKIYKNVHTIQSIIFNIID